MRCQRLAPRLGLRDMPAASGETGWSVHVLAPVSSRRYLFVRAHSRALNHLCVQ
jgi:hypothetical protein